MTKADFVNELFKFYNEKVGNPDNITSLSYKKDPATEQEFVYVSFGDRQKRFSVWGDNNRGILKDFVRFLQEKDNYCFLEED